MVFALQKIWMVRWLSIAGERRFVRSFRTLSTVSNGIALITIVALLPGHCMAQADSPHAETIRDLVAQLGSDQYVRRELASLELAKLGAEAVPDLVSAVQRSDLEQTERVLQLLQRIAAGETPFDPPVGWDALQTLVKSGRTSASSRAKAATNALTVRRHDQAREHLSRAGIQIGFSNVVMESSSINEEAVYVKDWDGDTTPLAWFGWLDRFQYAALEGPEVSGELLAAVARMPDLQHLLITNTHLTTSDLAPLRELNRLEQLEIRYSPVDDRAVDFFSQLPLRQKLVLSATKITPDGVKKLRSKLPAIQIVYKRGGFLGVICEPWAAECIISRVTVGGAAEAAGLQTNDIVIRIGEAKVQRFSDLQEAIFNYAPGDEVDVTYIRAGNIEKVSVTLGSLVTQQP